MPADAVPVTVPELAVGEHREHLELIDRPGGDTGRRRRRPAERLGLGPGVAVARRVEQVAARADPEPVDPARAPRHRRDPAADREPARLDRPEALDVRHQPPGRSASWAWIRATSAGADAPSTERTLTCRIRLPVPSTSPSGSGSTAPSASWRLTCSRWAMIAKRSPRIFID